MLKEPYGCESTADDPPESSSEPKGTTVTVFEPPTSLTMRIMSPVTLVVGSGRVSVVSSVPVTATMSSEGSIAYEDNTGSMVERTLEASKVRFPEPSVLSTEPGTGAALGQVNAPICIFDVALETLDVTIALHVIDMVLPWDHTRHHYFYTGFLNAIIVRLDEEPNGIFSVWQLGQKPVGRFSDGFFLRADDTTVVNNTEAHTFHGFDHSQNVEPFEIV